MKSITQLLNDYEVVVSELNAYREANFPLGSTVFVDCYRYKGEGKVVEDFDCSVTNLAVKLENGNTWWYPLKDCKPVE